MAATRPWKSWPENRLSAGCSETFRKGEPPCEPSADAGSDRASTARGRRRGSHRAKYTREPKTEDADQLARGDNSPAGSIALDGKFGAVSRAETTAKKWHKVAAFSGLLCHFSMFGIDPKQGCCKVWAAMRLLELKSEFIRNFCRRIPADSSPFLHCETAVLNRSAACAKGRSLCHCPFRSLNSQLRGARRTTGNRPAHGVSAGACARVRGRKNSAQSDRDEEPLRRSGFPA